VSSTSDGAESETTRAQHSRASRSPWLVGAAVVLVMALVGGVAYVAATRSSSSGSTRSGVTHVGPSGGTAAGPNGTSVVVPAGALSANGTIRIVSVPSPAAVGDGVVPVVEPIQIELTGARLRGPVEVRIPLPAGTSPSATLVALHIHSGGAVEALDGRYDSSTNTMSMSVASFSILGIFRIALDKLKAIARSVLSALTGGLVTDSRPPDCQPGGDQGGWHLSQVGNSVWSCYEPSADGRAVKITNKRRYGLVVVWPSGVAAPTSQRADFTAQLSQLVTFGNEVVLGPGDTAQFDIPATSKPATLAVKYDGFTQAMSSLIVSADILSAISAHMPWAKFKSSKTFLDALRLKDCVSVAGTDLRAAAGNPAGTITRLLTSCFNAQLLKTVFGNVIGSVLAAPIATVLGTVAFFITSGEAAVDLVIGATDSTVTRPQNGLHSAKPATDRDHGTILSIEALPSLRHRVFCQVFSNPRPRRPCRKPL
jgi:hypothetical protein